ncbi:MAG: hypothetical protein HKN03_10510 [Acidimicrobiales bacterium]|nr:hypothetical protein [Acidimicrobiales bacterium]
MPILRPRQGGYVLATTALMLIPLMVFAAFAVDVGGWYVSADEAQRAADAAALAASVRAPHAANVQAEAVRVAALNGVVDQPDGPGADGKPQYPQVVSKVLNSATVEVRITVEGESHFGQVVMDSIPIERYAVAELTRPLPMGQPTSALGTGVDSVYPGETNNFWLNIHRPSTTRGNGGLLEADNDGNGGPNPWNAAEPDGYLFGVDIPNDGQSYDLEVRLTCFDEASGGVRLNLHVPDTTNTPNFIRDNITSPPYSSQDFFQQNCGATPYVFGAAEESAVWQKVATNIQTAAVGDWLLQARHVIDPATVGATPYQRTLYSLRVVNTSSGTPHCSVIASATCATVRPINWLGIFTDDGMFVDGGGSLGVAKKIELYLAEVGPENYRSTLRVNMFDTADGIDEVRFLMPPKDAASSDPALNQRYYAPLDWEIVDDSLNPVGSPGAGNYRNCAQLDCIRYPSGQDRTWFNNKIVQVEIDLSQVPGGYSCTTDCWVKVEYTVSGTIGETTTWQANIIGDPLRLIE